MLTSNYLDLEVWRVSQKMGVIFSKKFEMFLKIKIKIELKFNVILIKLNFNFN